VTDHGEVSARVLVVDDEADILNLLTVLLDDDPRCQVVDTAADLTGAVDLAASQKPDVIILDFSLKGSTCETILPELRTLLPDARIVIFTASREAAEAASVRRLGADAVAEKATTSFDELLDLAFIA
jgi:DNA-binding NarL/FixJ family response regulator